MPLMMLVAPAAISSLYLAAHAQGLLRSPAPPGTRGDSDGPGSLQALRVGSSPSKRKICLSLIIVCHFPQSQNDPKSWQDDNNTREPRINSNRLERIQAHAGEGGDGPFFTQPRDEHPLAVHT